MKAIIGVFSCSALEIIVQLSNSQPEKQIQDTAAASMYWPVQQLSNSQKTNPHSAAVDLSGLR